MRKSIIIGNWKMNKNYAEALKFVKIIDSNCAKLNLEAGIAAPYLYLNDLAKISKHLIVAAQNCFFEEKGAFTGEISINMLKDIKVTHVIIGHSERRTIFGESDELINKKNKAILEKGLIPIICCGETLDQYNKKKTLNVVHNQIKLAFQGIDKSLASKAIIAYEPIWAIGTGKTATPEIAQNVCKEIRKKLIQIYDNQTADNIRIQYGGSVTPENVKTILIQEDIDGALVGGASLDENSFMKLIK